MEIFGVKADHDLMMVRPASTIDTRLLLEVNTDRITWPAQRTLKVTVGGWYNKWVPSDCAYFDSLPPLCLSSYAQAALSPLLHHNGFFVDTDLDEEGLYRMFFVTRRLNCFDFARSEHTIDSPGRPFSVSRYELHESELKDHPIFLMNGHTSQKFVSEAFVEAVDKHNLTGFKFEKIWSSVTGGIQRVPFVRIEIEDPKKTKKLALQKQAAVRKIIEARR